METSRDMKTDKLFVNRRKFRSCLVDRSSQLKIVFITLVYILLIFITTAGVILFPFLSKMSLSHNLETQYAAAQTFLILMNQLLPVVIIILILFFVHQLIITHRIWGPLWNMAATFKKIGRGDLTRKIHTRKRDYLKKECRQLNEMIDGLTDIISNTKKDHHQLVSDIDELMKSVKDLDEKPDIAENLKTISQTAEMLSEDLNRFILGSKFENSKSKNHPNMKFLPF